MGRLGSIMGRLRAIVVRLGTILGRPGLLRLSSEPLRAILEASRAILAARWRPHENPGVARSSQEFEAPPRWLFGDAAGPLADSKQEAGNRTGETKGQTANDSIRKSRQRFAALRPQRGPADMYVCASA